MAIQIKIRKATPKELQEAREREKKKPSEKPKE